MALAHPAAYNYIIMIGNEGLTNRANAISLGLHIGASDYLLAWPTINHYGAFIEVKPDDWKLTKSKQDHHDRQISFGNKMMKKGYAFYFCVGIDELMTATNDYLNAD